MKTSSGTILIGCLLLAAASAHGREWISRDGKYKVSAELLTVENNQAVLRRDDGAVIRVPLGRLSLGDVKYVQEAMDALNALPGTAARQESSKDSSAAKEPPAGATLPGATPEKESELPAPELVPEPGAPPLAESGTSKWQTVPDPPSIGYELGPRANVEISLTVRSLFPFVAFPTAPSPFVVLGNDPYRGLRQVWDLRRQKVVGEIDCEIGETDKFAVSPDGAHLAVHARRDDKIHIWSFSSHEIVRRLSLSQKYPSVRYLDFAGPKRIIVGESFTKHYGVYDIASGEQLCRIDAEPEGEGENCAVSPGGTYLAVCTSYPPDLSIFDTRNGYRAGRLRCEDSGSVRAEAMIFSPDGKELACWFGSGASSILQTWDLTTGERAAAHRFAEDPTRSVSGTHYRSRILEYLADGSGWLLAGSIIIDRGSGQIIWQDRDATAGAYRLPRRVVDADRMLGFRVKEKEYTLCILPLPKEKLKASRDALASGGDPADAGLPPITEVTAQGATELVLADVPWNYQPTPLSLPPEAAARSRLPLGPGTFDFGRLLFSRADAAIVAAGMSVDASSAPWNSSARLPQACQLYNLRTGQTAARFAIPFPTEMIDLSPDGKLGLFRIDGPQDRLDVWDLNSGQHVAGFRPFQGERSRDRKVVCARFAGDDHLVAATETQRLAGWHLPDCRLVYSYPPATGSILALTQDRRAVFVMSNRTPHLIDSRSGQPLGTLAQVATDNILVPRQAVVSADGKKLAEVYFYVDGHLLVVWDLANGEKLLQLELLDDVSALAWCGPQHLLLKPSMDAARTYSMIDVHTGLVVWKYHLENGQGVWTAPDDRVWYCCQKNPQLQPELVAVTLPEENVRLLLSQIEMPAPLLGPGTDISVQTLFENPPQVLPQGWSDLAAIDESIQGHFTRQLQKNGVRIATRSSVRLLAGIKNQQADASVRIRGPLGRGGTLLLSTTQLTPYVILLDPRGNPVWEQQGEIEDPELSDLENRPAGMDAATCLKLKRWEAAIAWFKTVHVPCPVYDPSLQRGLGESTVGPNGTKVLRSPGPALKKPPDKVADSWGTATELQG